MTTITERYSHGDHFANLLVELGMTNTQVARLQSDGFTSMQILVSHYQSGGASNLEKYLRDLNKTFANSAAVLRVYYNPVIITRLCGCLNYFSLCVMSFHTIPDIDLVSQELARNLGSFWNKFKADKKIQDENDDDTNIDLPKLKGAASWISFRDAFTHKLRDTSTSRGFSLAYLVDTTVRPVTHGNSALLESDIIDLEEEDVFETKTIHFGSSYRGDNKKLWNMLEAALLNSDPYNMIAQFFRTKDGRKAWIALKSHYEGEDYVQQIREEAMSRLKTVHYRGETRNFKWENYVSAHIKAHKQLLDVGYNNGHGLDDATKIQFLRSNIVPQADMHVSLAVARPYEKKPFQEYLTFLTTEVNATILRKKQVYGSERRVSSFKRNNNNRPQSNRGPNNRNNRRFFGRLDLGPVLNETVDGKRIESRHYSSEDFGKLTRNQRGAVIHLNKERRRLAIENKNKSGNDTHHNSNISALTSMPPDTLRTIIAAIDSNRNESPDDNALTNSTSSSVTFSDNTANPPSATSGQIGDYLASARKKARNVRAFSSRIIKTEHLPTISASSRTKPNAIIRLNKNELTNGCRLGLDSHADVSCVGKHGRILEVIEGQTSIVRPFNDKYQPIINVQTVNAAFAVDVANGGTYIVHLNQCLDFRSSMEDSILCTNQARFHGVVVNDVPIQFDQNSSHSIIFPSHDKLEFPLKMNGPVSYLSVRYPTDWDMDHFPHIHLTDDASEWKPEETFNVNSVITTTYVDQFFPTYEKTVMIHGVRKLSDTKDLTPAYLCNLWNITLNDARDTIRATTQRTIRQSEGMKTRRFKTVPHQRLYKNLGNSYLSKFCSDTFKGKIPSLRGNKYVQLFVNRANFTRSYPMISRSHAPQALDRFFHEVGLPSEMLTDNAPEFVEGEWRNMCLKYYVKQKFTEPYTPWQNPAELQGGILKRKLRTLMKLTSTPVQLWDYAWQYVSEIRSVTAMKHMYLDGMTPLEKVCGYTPDISEFILFSWYEIVWYFTPHDSQRNQLGRWLGPATNLGQGLAYNVLTIHGKVVVRSTVTTLSSTEKTSPTVIKEMKQFDDTVGSILGNISQSTIEDINDKYNNLFESTYFDEEDLYSTEYGNYDTEGKHLSINNIEENISNEIPINELHDDLKGEQIKIPHDGETKLGTLIGRKRFSDGSLAGQSNMNPKDDHSVYEVQLNDGSYSEYTANIILENMDRQVDELASKYSNLKGIIGHRKDESVAINKENGWTSNKGARKRVITTKGWEIEIELTDGSTFWSPLTIVKHSMPIELAEYSIAKNINDEPAFAWWVTRTLRRRKNIIKALRTPKKLMKYGINIPGSVEQAYEFDAENGNQLWADAIKKELKNVIIAFNLLEIDEKLPVGSKLIPYHFIFDVKADLTRKARLVAGGHKHNVPTHTTFSSVAGRDSVRLGFLLAALNSLHILMCDIGNAYLNAPNREKVHVRVGPELFGPENAGKYAIIERALYGLKTAAAAWRSHFQDTIINVLGYKPTYADNDVYMKERTRKDGTKYYSYLVVYVDDVLCIDEKPKVIIDHIASVYRVKDGSVEAPSRYLGMNVKKWVYSAMNGELMTAYALGASTYIKEAVRIVKKNCSDCKLTYKSKSRFDSCPFTNNDYRPELDATEYCNEAKTTLFQNFIGMLRWSCELGRVDILHETSLLSQYLVKPRIGHLTQSISIFGYLEKFKDRWLVMDPQSYQINWTPMDDEPSPESRAEEMKKLYVDAEEHLPHNMPKPLGKGIDINVFVDADHAGNKITRRSHTGIVIYCNCSPILWFSKRQNTVETSTFSSEIIALKIAVELVEGLRYKLRMFGVPINGPARIFCDNKSVVINTSFPNSPLKKKHCAVAYGKVKSAIAAGVAFVYFERSESNIADLLTKVLPYSKRERLVRSIMD